MAKKPSRGKRTPGKAAKKVDSDQIPKKLLIEIEVDTKRLSPPHYKGTPPHYRGSFRVTKVIKIRPK